MNGARQSDGTGYSWPMVTIVHPDHGSFLVHIHGVRKRGTGTLTLMAFANGATSVQQAGIVRAMARGVDSEIVQLSEDDVSDDLGVFLAAKVHADPGTGVLIVPGGDWGLTGAGRKAVRN